MSSNKIFFEYEGTPYSTVVPEGQEVTEAYMQKVFMKIEKQKKAKAQATLYASATSDSGSGTENKEDENIVQTSNGPADAEKAKKEALEQMGKATQANFEDVAQEEASKTTFSDRFQEKNVYENALYDSVSSSAIEAEVDKSTIDVSSSEVAEHLVAEAVLKEVATSAAIEGLEELNATKDDAYLFMDSEKTEDHGLLDMNAFEEESSQQETNVLSRNVSEKEKTNDNMLGFEAQFLTETEVEKNDVKSHFSPVQEMKTQNQDKNPHVGEGSVLTDGGLQSQGLAESIDKASQSDNLENLKKTSVNSMEKSASEQVMTSEKEQERLKSEKSLPAKEQDKSKKIDKTSQAKQKSDIGEKRKVSAAEIRKILGATGRPMGKNSGKTKSSPYQYSRIIDNAKSKNSAVLNMAQQVRRGRGN